MSSCGFNDNFWSIYSPQIKSKNMIILILQIAIVAVCLTAAQCAPAQAKDEPNEFYKAQGTETNEFYRPQSSSRCETLVFKIS